MTALTVSERFFMEFCANNGIRCTRVPPARTRTPDFVVDLHGLAVTCEIKQIDENTEDRREIAELGQPVSVGRFLPNRIRGKLKRVSAQLKAASTAGTPTVLVIYDNTPFKSYSSHQDVVEAMFGRDTVAISLPRDRSLPPQVSAPFFGADRGVGPKCNTAVSAVALLDGGPRPPFTLRVYPNPYAAVRLHLPAFDGLPASQPLLPATRTVTP